MIVNPKFKLFMRKISLLLLICGAVQVSLWAQPTICLPSDSPCTDEEFCVDVTTKDFTDILTMQFSINWDPALLEFSSVDNFGLPNMDITNFDIVQANGTLAFTWEAVDGIDCNDPNSIGINVPDGSVLFRLCFIARGSYGTISPLSVTNDPVPIVVTRENTGCQNIGGIIKDGLISHCVRPFTVTASEETAVSGDLVCVDYFVTGFDDLTSMQFSMNWDCSVLEFNNVIPSENLINLAVSSFGFPPEVDCGTGTLSWSFFDPFNPGVNVPDSTVIFQICYNVIGPCESGTVINFAGEPTPIEVTNVVVDGFELSTIFTPGSVTVGDCDPTGLQVSANCGPVVDINDNICIEVFSRG